MINEPKIVEVKDIIQETPTIKTFLFDWDENQLGKPNPGEFVMIWNFSNEKPMSISQINDNELAISVKNIGEFTSQLHELKIGDQIGVRGSYGNGFDNSFEGKKILAIGGFLLLLFGGIAYTIGAVFYGFGKKAKLLYPDDVIDQFRGYMDRIREMY